MNIAALLTGRGNNTLKNKNILPVIGKPLMSYPASEARKCADIDHFFCSSDDDRILACGRDLGYEEIKRPVELSLPSSQHIDAIRHSVETMRLKGYDPDILIVLLCNSATTKKEWIEESIKIIREDDTVSSVCPVEKD